MSTSSVLILLFAFIAATSLAFAATYLLRAENPVAPLPAATFGTSPINSTNNAPAAPTPGGEGAPASGDSTPPVLPENHLNIPSLNIDAPVEPRGIGNGTLLLPPPSKVALFDGGASPGDTSGTVLVSGHVNSRTLGRGALFDLAQIQPDARIWITDDAGTAHEYAVTALDAIEHRALPQDIFTSDGDPRLVLVTCGGDVVDTPQGRVYEYNVLVYATPTGKVG